MNAILIRRYQCIVYIILFSFGIDCTRKMTDKQTDLLTSWLGRVGTAAAAAAAAIPDSKVS